MNGWARLAIVTGPIGAGKTTTALRVAEKAATRGFTCGGFVSPARIGSSGEKEGIDLADVASGERRELATVLGTLRGPTVGMYSFDQESLDWGMCAFTRALNEERDLVLVDELGRLEFEQGAGFAPVLPALASGRYHRALAVVRLGYHFRLIYLPGKVNVKLFWVPADPLVRDEMPEKVLAWLGCTPHPP